MKFGQIIEDNLRNILEKSYTKYVEKVDPRPSKNQNSSTVSNAIKLVFIACPSGNLLKCIKSAVLSNSFYCI